MWNSLKMEDFISSNQKIKAAKNDMPELHFV